MGRVTSCTEMKDDDEGEDDTDDAEEGSDVVLESCDGRETNRLPWVTMDSVCCEAGLVTVKILVPSLALKKKAF